MAPDPHSLLALFRSLLAEEEIDRLSDEMGSHQELLESEPFEQVLEWCRAHVLEHLTLHMLYHGHRHRLCLCSDPKEPRLDSPRFTLDSGSPPTHLSDAPWYVAPLQRIVIQRDFLQDRHGRATRGEWSEVPTFGVSLSASSGRYLEDSWGESHSGDPSMITGKDIVLHEFDHPLHAVPRGYIPDYASITAVRGLLLHRPRSLTLTHMTVNDESGFVHDLLLQDLLSRLYYMALPYYEFTHTPYTTSDRQRLSSVPVSIYFHPKHGTNP